jgi:hypothetical protein
MLCYQRLHAGLPSCRCDFLAQLLLWGCLNEAVALPNCIVSLGRAILATCSLHGAVALLTVG